MDSCDEKVRRDWAVARLEGGREDMRIDKTLDVGSENDQKYECWPED